MTNSRLRKLRSILPLNLRLKIYNAVCSPALDYASTVWGMFSENVINKVSKLEHMAARTLTGNYDFINTRGATLMSNLNMSNFIDRIKYNLSVSTYKAVHGLVPDHIANSIFFSYEVSQRNIRSSDNMNLYKPKPHCELFKKSFSYAGPNQWHYLPLPLQKAVTVHNFKLLYK